MSNGVLNKVTLDENSTPFKVWYENIRTLLLPENNIFWEKHILLIATYLHKESKTIFL